MKIALSLISGVLLFVGGDFYFSKKYYALGFDTAEQQYKKMLAKEGYAMFDPKTGQWRLYPKLNREVDNLEDYAYSLETELNLVKSQMSAKNKDINKK